MAELYVGSTITSVCIPQLLNVVVDCVGQSFILERV